ncbi:MAG: hypothetical protein ACKPKO_27265, partial [Candidatus Fonsibacter sp.]
MSQVDNDLAGKQHLMSSSTALSLASITATGLVTANKLVSNYIEPLVSGGSIFIRSDVIGFGRTAFMTASSDSFSAYAPLRAEKGLRVLSGITSGYFTDPLNPTGFNQTASINQNGVISTLGAYTARET